MTLLQLDVPLVATSPTWVTVTEVPLQESNAVTEPVFGGGTCEKHCTVTGPGHVINGGTSSFTVITCWQLEELPQASAATHVRVIVWLQLEVGSVGGTCV